MTEGHFYRAALYATRSFAWASVRPSVCLPVRLSNAWIVTKRKHLAKKVQLWYRKSPTSFPISLRWTAYVASKPPKGPQRRQFFRFPYRKLDFPRRKSGTKVLCVKTFSGKVVRHSLAYLSVHKWLVGDVPFYLTWRTPFWNGDFQAIFSCTISVVKNSEKCSLSLIGSRHELSNEPKMNILRCV